MNHSRASARVDAEVTAGFANAAALAGGGADGTQGRAGAHPSLKPAARWMAVALLVAALPVAGWVFFESQRLIRADLTSMAARKKVEQWVAGQRPVRSAAEWQAAEVELKAALAITPDSPNLHAVLGDLYLAAGGMEGMAEDERRALWQRAISQYRQSIALRPGDAQNWAALASALAFSGEVGAPMHQAWSRALALGPSEAHVQPMLMQAAFRAWDSATPEMQQWATGFYERADRETRKAINRMGQAYGVSFEADDELAR